MKIHDNSKIKQNQNKEHPIMRLNDQIQIKIQRLRKNIFADVLKYNQQIADQRQYRRKLQKQHEQQQFQRLNQRQLFSIRQEQQQRNKYRFNQREYLKREHEKQINEKKRRQENEKKYDLAYADIQKSYQEFSNQRRMYDLERMFNRKNYRASLAEDPLKRFKTEPNNPELDNLSFKGKSSTPRYNNSVSAQKVQNQITRSHRYQDSLDNIKIKQELNAPYQTPKKKLRNFQSSQQQNVYM